MEGDTFTDEGAKGIKYIIKNHPAGETQDVLEHLITLLQKDPASINSNPVVLAALRKHYETHRQHIVLPDG